MRTIAARVAGEPVRGWFAETPGDLQGFRRWVADRASAGTPVAVDSETTGLGIFGRDFRVRLVQFGDGREGWLIPVEYGAAFVEAVRWALATLPKLIIHNAPFDGLAFDRVGLADLEGLFSRVRDTKIMAHLVDSRPPEEGGTGTSLKPLSVEYLDPCADDGQKALHAVFRGTGHDKVTGWAHIPIDHPDYLRYALLDVIYPPRLLPILWGKLQEMGVPAGLVEYEHELALIGAVIQRRGMPLDVEYATALVGKLQEERQYYARVAKAYGVDSVDAPRQVAAALLEMGEELTERTESGQYAVGKDVLLPLADLNGQWERIGARDPNPVADAVLRAKRAGKWSKSYAEAMLDLRDENDVIHPMINTMGARTARWSVSNPPLQQLPSSDWTVRRCIVSSPGNLIVASDFSQVELRVLVGLAGAREICERVNAGEDLHTLTTRMVYGIGPEVSDEELKDDRRRKICKTISLGKAYAGGIKTLARQTGLPIPQVKQAVGKYDRALPAIKRFGRRLTEQAQRNGMMIRTPSGRVLRLNRDKSYTAIAYLCQSTARDILGQALVDARKRGLLPYIIGVVHDEVIADVPKTDAKDVARELGDVMTFPRAFGLVDITSEPEVYGDNWGMGYKGPSRYAGATA